MSLKSSIIKIFASRISKQVHASSIHALEDQSKLRHQLLQKARSTIFGLEHNFDRITNQHQFSDQIPIREYEALSPYIQQIIEGKTDILWPGKPKYFAKTSGTTSGVKYIPISKESMPNHINAARNALLNYIHQSGNSGVFDGKMIFLSGSPTLETKGNIPTGRLSGIVNHEVPAWVQGNKLPSFNTNCIEEWEDKLQAIVKETIQADMRIISGIPPWVQMYYEHLLKVSGKKAIKDVFPNYSLFMYGGVNFSPYRNQLEAMVGKKIDSIELFPASEGFFAFQNDLNDPGMLLLTNAGIYYEFVPVNEIHQAKPTRLSLHDVALDTEYALIINNNAGLWAYNIGDTVRFTSLQPYKVVVTGRIKHHISAFGEHVIAKEVEEAMRIASTIHEVHTVEFTVAPQVICPQGGLPYHQWYIEFAKPPKDLAAFAKTLDENMTKQNIYYADLIEGKILRPLVITPLAPDSFRAFMKAEGKLGGQNKVPRLTNDRHIAEKLDAYKINQL